jgi:hypothetical protein
MIEEVKPNFYVKQTWNGKYIRVYPIKKNLNEPLTLKNINWKNFLIGDKTILFFFFIMIILLFAYKHDIEGLKEVYENPCKYCDYQLFKNPNMTIVCTLENEKLGLCHNINLSRMVIR